MARAPLMLFGLTLATIAFAFTLSAFALAQFGINYGDPGGFLLAKIHPATYLVTASLLARLALHKHPTRFLIAAASRHRGATVFLWIVGSLIAYVAVNLRVPLSLLVDTFVFPILALILLDGIDETSARRLARLLHFIFAVNAVLGLAEMASGWRLTPIVVLGVDMSALEHRSSALFGHPLGNAMFTGLYAIILAVGGGRDLPFWGRFPAILLQTVAMFSFGGRLATVTMLSLLLLLALRQLALVLAGQRFRASSASVYLVLLPVMLVAVAGAYAAGFFDLLLDRFVNDQGSAQARVVMFDLFPHFSWFQLLFGPDQELLRSLMWTEGTEYGIESFWVSFLLTYGAVPSLFFFLGFGAFLFDLSQHAHQGVGWVITYFLIVISGSLSIGDKTLALGALVITSMILLRLPETERAAFAWPRALPRARHAAATSPV
ncbi:hypothetical protein SAMN05444161_3608 [Rhizobiales bacterium GAS191]|nr:hypothetical protein SAMN05444161_3608 [Rhizobiales bacterium GAS191]